MNFCFYNDDSGFISQSVQEKEYIHNEIEKSAKTRYKIYPSLNDIPQSEKNDKTIYLIGPDETVVGDDKFEEYIYDVDGNTFTKIGETSTDISHIEELIPSTATPENKLTDKNYVDSSIATSTATFRGTSATGLTENEFLSWANSLTHDVNDYCYWNTTDSNGNTIYKRYKYDGNNWSFEYSLNNSSFTSDEWAAIQSGITATKVTEFTGKYTKPQNGIPSTDMSSSVQNSLSKADSALQEHQSLDGTVKYTSQTKTAEEKQIARNNIGITNSLFESITLNDVEIITITDEYEGEPGTNIYEVETYNGYTIVLFDEVGPISGLTITITSDSQYRENAYYFTAAEDFTISIQSPSGHNYYKGCVGTLDCVQDSSYVLSILNGVAVIGEITVPTVNP